MARDSIVGQLRALTKDGEEIAGDPFTRAQPHIEELKVSV
jgi:hypothetical protein